MVQCLACVTVPHAFSTAVVTATAQTRDDGCLDCWGGLNLPLKVNQAGYAAQLDVSVEEEAIKVASAMTNMSHW